MRALLTHFFLLLCVSSVGQQFQNIKIDEGPGVGGPNEPTLSISRNDPRIIVGGSNTNRLYFSMDGGQTWKKKTIKSRYGVYGDPCIISISDNRFLYFHLSLPEGNPYFDDSFLDRIVCQQSKKTPNRWSRGTYTGLNPPKDQDKEWACYNSEKDEVYLTWTQFDAYDSRSPEDSSVVLFSKSTDQGKTWAKPVRLNRLAGNCLDDDSTTEGVVTAFGLQNEIYAVWAFDGKIWFKTSSDGGSTWDKDEKPIARQVGGWNQNIPGIMRCNGFPTLKTIRTGLHKGRLILCWSDQREGPDNTDVLTKFSDDGGKTWSKARVVNDDSTKTHQFLPWMTVDDSTGFVYVLFYDRRAYDDEHTDVYIAVSTDGGITYKNTKISTSPFRPVEQAFFGDYINVDAVGGLIRPIWTRYDEGRLSIWTAIIDAHTLLQD